MSSNITICEKVNQEDIFEYIQRRGNFDYISDMKFSMKWMEIVKDMIDKNQINLFAGSDWDKFFSYTLSYDSLDLLKVYTFVMENTV